MYIVVSTLLGSYFDVFVSCLTWIKDDDPEYLASNMEFFVKLQ
jgi:hypothetical protein